MGFQPGAAADYLAIAVNLRRSTLLKLSGMELLLDHVLRKPRLPKTVAPRRERNVVISDGPAERLGEDARIVVQIGQFRPCEIKYGADLWSKVTDEYDMSDAAGG